MHVYLLHMCDSAAGAENETMKKSTLLKPTVFISYHIISDEDNNSR